MELGKYIFEKDKLKSEYLEKFEFVEHYGEIRMIPGKVMSEKMMDLIDLMLEAQENGKPVETVVGKNIEDFSKNYFSDVSALNLIFSLTRHLRRFFTVVLIFELLWVFLSLGNDEGFDFFKYTTDIGPYVLGFVTGFSGLIVADIVGAILAKFGNYSKKIWSVIAIITSVGMFIFTIACCLKYDFVSIPGFPVILVSSVYIAVYYIVAFAYRYKKTGSFKKPKNDYESTFWGIVASEINKTDYSRDKSIVKIFAKRYKKVNARRLKRGKNKVTTEEYFAKTNKQNKYISIIGLFAGFAIGLSSMFWGSESGFETATDLIFFMVLFGIIIWGYLAFFKKINKITILEEKAILGACQNYGVELDVYYDMLERGEIPEDKEDTKI